MNKTTGRRKLRRDMPEVSRTATSPVSCSCRVDGGENLVHFGGELWTGRMVTLCSGQLRNATLGVCAVLFSKREVLPLWGRVHDTTYLES